MVLSMPSWLCCEITHNKLPNFTHTQFQIFSNTSTWKTCQKPCTRSTLTTSGWSTKSSMTSVKQGSTTCRNLLPPKQSKTQQQKLLPPLIQGYLFATLSFSFIFCSGFGFCWLKTKLWSFILITLLWRIGQFFSSCGFFEIGYPECLKKCTLPHMLVGWGVKFAKSHRAKLVECEP